MNIQIFCNLQEAAHLSHKDKLNLVFLSGYECKWVHVSTEFMLPPLRFQTAAASRDTLCAAHHACTDDWWARDRGWTWNVSCVVCVLLSLFRTRRLVCARGEFATGWLLTADPVSLNRSDKSQRGGFEGWGFEPGWGTCLAPGLITYAQQGQRRPLWTGQTSLHMSEWTLGNGRAERSALGIRSLWP